MSPVATPTPLAGPFVAGSGVDLGVIVGAMFIPAYSTSLPDSAVIQVNAPGFVSLRTRVGHLRQKGGRLYLLPNSIEYRARLVQLHGSLAAFPTRPLTHWDVSNIGVQASSELAADRLSMDAMREGVSRFNNHLISVESRVRLTPVDRGSLRMEVAQLGWACGQPSLDGPRTNCAYFFRSLEEARQANIWVRGLFQVVGPFGEIPDGGLTGRLNYSMFNDLSPMELAVLRVFYNRCHGARMDSINLETEDHLQDCRMP